MNEAVMDAITEAVTQRPSTHGDFSDNAAISQQLQAVMTASKNWDGLTVVQREALQMYAHKIGRILSGDPDEPDHWVDMGGYSRLVVDRLPKREPTK